MAETKGKSPYNKYNKKPYRYSPLYNEWRAAKLGGQPDLARELGKKHAARYLHSIEDEAKAA